MNGVCAPNKGLSDIADHYTCFEHNELKEIARIFNIYIQTNKLCPVSNSKFNNANSNYCIPTKLIDIDNKNKKELWYSIYTRLKPICKYEYCWLDLDFISLIKDPVLQEKIFYFTFKPKMTLKTDSWLNTQDINYILQQYQVFDKSFKFLGALPSDFYKIKKIKYSDILNHNKYGIVFNLDSHYQKGSHWVGFLVDNITKSIEYFDSGGNKPNKNINKFIKKIYKYLKKKGFNYTIKINNKKHQFKNSECGIYSTYFIIRRILGKSFEEISNNIILDDEMNDIRKTIIFRPR